MLHIFESSKPGAYGEDRKAKIKNYNLPILRYMWMGSRDKELTCAITGLPGFRTDVPDIVTGLPKTRFTLEFNHIRQEAYVASHAGISKDKCGTPSAVFRGTYLDADYVSDKINLIEFMCIIPVNKEYHKYISQDSAKGNITLQNFPKDKWTWVLQNKKNFNQFIQDMNLNGLEYDDMIDHLSDIDHPNIRKRLKYNTVPDTWYLI
jgi:hypothetical protein